MFVAWRAGWLAPPAWQSHGDKIKQTHISNNKRSINPESGETPRNCFSRTNKNQATEIRITRTLALGHHSNTGVIKPLYTRAFPLPISTHLHLICFKSPPSPLFLYTDTLKPHSPAPCAPPSPLLAQSTHSGGEEGGEGRSNMESGAAGELQED